MINKNGYIYANMALYKIANATGDYVTTHTPDSLSNEVVSFSIRTMGKAILQHPDPIILQELDNIHKHSIDFLKDRSKLRQYTPSIFIKNQETIFWKFDLISRDRCKITENCCNNIKNEKY